MAQPQAIPAATAQQMFDIYNVEAKTLPRQLPDAITANLCTAERKSLVKNNNNLISDLSGIVSDLTKKIKTKERKLEVIPFTGNQAAVKEALANEASKLSSTKKSLRVLNRHEKVLEWKTSRKQLMITALVFTIVGAALAGISSLFAFGLPLIIAGSALLAIALGTGIGAIAKNCQYNKELNKTAQYFIDLKKHAAHLAFAEVNNLTQTTDPQMVKDALKVFNHVAPALIAQGLVELSAVIQSAQKTPGNSQPRGYIESSLIYDAPPMAANTYQQGPHANQEFTTPQRRGNDGQHNSPNQTVGVEDFGRFAPIQPTPALEHIGKVFQDKNADPGLGQFLLNIMLNCQEVLKV